MGGNCCEKVKRSMRFSKMSAKMDAAKIFTKVFREPIIENMRETESAEDYLIE